MEYFLSVGAERSGPFTQFQVIEGIRGGKYLGTELVWRKGLDEWRPLRELDDFIPYWQPTAEQIQKAEHARRVARTALDTPQPWLRFWARTIDYIWFSTVLGLVQNGVVPQSAMSWFQEWLKGATPGKALLVMAALNAAIFLLFVPLEALWISRRGTTPGKALLRIQVRQMDGSLPSFAQALQRAAQVYVKGVALCVMPLCLFAMSWSRMRLLQLGCTSWDEQTGLRVEHGEPEFWRYLVVLVVVAAVALGTALSLLVGVDNGGAIPSLPK